MNELDRIGILLTDLPVYLANGGLVIIYWLAENSAALISLLCAILMALLPDAEIQQRAGFRPRRNDRNQAGSSINRAPRTAQTMTALVFITWLVAQWDMGAPVPWIGAAMWVAGLLVCAGFGIPAFQLALVRQSRDRHLFPGCDRQPHLSQLHRPSDARTMGGVDRFE